MFIFIKKILSNVADFCNQRYSLIVTNTYLQRQKKNLSKTISFHKKGRHVTVNHIILILIRKYSCTTFGTSQEKVNTILEIMYNKTVLSHI